MLFVGDVHSRVSLVEAALTMTAAAKIIFLGDLIDGPDGAQGSANCVKLVRQSGAELVLGNHEAYPVFAKDQHELANFWGNEPNSDEAIRVWNEWMAIRQLLDDEDMQWLRSRPLFVRGEGWIAVHAKVTTTLPAAYVDDSLNSDQIELLDNTKKPFWTETYDGCHGHAYFGHTRRSKLDGKFLWANGTLLDWDAKSLKGTAGACFLGQTPFGLDN